MELEPGWRLFLQDEVFIRDVNDAIDAALSTFRRSKSFAKSIDYCPMKQVGPQSFQSSVTSGAALQKKQNRGSVLQKNYWLQSRSANRMPNQAFKKGCKYGQETASIYAHRAQTVSING
jgi:hypothetical protein